MAIGILGVAILSLVGILGSTFQQADDIMQTNRALAGATRLVAALDNPRSIVSHQAADRNGLAPSLRYLHQDSALFTPPLDPGPAPASNFDLVYRMLWKAKDNSAQNAIWLYVYERKIVSATADFNGAVGGYSLTANPSVMEVASARANSDSFTAKGASDRNVIGAPLRVRLSLSKLLHGQRFRINPSTNEPTDDKYRAGLDDLPNDPNLYPLAYLPIVAEFFPHDYSEAAVFNAASFDPILVQNIVISR